MRAVEAWPDLPDCTDCNDFMRGINMAAHGFVGKMMAEKDISFFREFGDRLDGKPAQTIQGDPENPLHMISEVRRRVVDGDA